MGFVAIVLAMINVVGGFGDGPHVEDVQKRAEEEIVDVDLIMGSAVAVYCWIHLRNPSYELA